MSEQRRGRPRWDGVRFVWPERRKRAPPPKKQPAQIATVIDLLEHLPANYLARKKPELRAMITERNRP